MGKIPTKSWVKAKKPISVNVEKIRPTNPLIGNILNIKYFPILLVRADDGYFYIADGNHRFFKKLFSRDKYLEAWVLEEGDQRKVCGDPLPQYVGEWKEGVISLKKLSNMAKQAYKDIQIDIDPVLANWPPAEDYEIRKKDSTKSFQEFEGRDLEILTLSLFNSVLKIIKGESSLELESAINNMSEQDLSSLYECFMDGGVKALKKRLKVKDADKQYPLFKENIRSSDGRIK